MRRGLLRAQNCRSKPSISSYLENTVAKSRQNWVDRLAGLGGLLGLSAAFVKARFGRRGHFSRAFGVFVGR